MKTLTKKFINSSDKELFFKVLMLSSLSVMVCSKFNKSSTIINKAESIKLTSIYRDNFGDFDKVHIPNKAPVIAKMISVLRPGFGAEQTNEVAGKISEALKKYKIEPQIVVAIIDTESNFNHDLVSSTGDLSLAQVNVDVWNKEFTRMGIDPIVSERLIADQAYSLEVMAQILHILKTRYAKNDRRWYARYHSKTKKHKRVYLAKLEERMKLLEKSRIVETRVASY